MSFISISLIVAVVVVWDLAEKIETMEAPMAKRCDATKYETTRGEIYA